MRNITQTELLDDLTALQYQIITPKIADRISQHFHFDDFFAPQMKTWSEMSVEDQRDFINQLGDDRARTRRSVRDNMTYAEFFTKLSYEKKSPRYSSFNVEMMNEVLKKYQPKAVYDPCMGWGHRLLMTAARGIDYYGADIRSETVRKNCHIRDFIMTNLPSQPYQQPHTHLKWTDGAKYIAQRKSADPSDILFTCPPYYDDEVYSEDGIENASYQEFLDWWGEVAISADKIGLQTIAFQITPKYGDDLVKMTEKAGYTLTDVIKNTRDNGDAKWHHDVKGNHKQKLYGQVYIMTKPKGEL